MNPRRSILASSLLVLAACGGDDAPVVRDLARGFEADVRDEKGLWVFATVGEDDWIERAGHWAVRDPFLRTEIPLDLDYAPRMHSLGESVPFVLEGEEPPSDDSGITSHFRSVRSEVRLFLPPHRWPSDEYKIGYRLRIGQVESVAVPREDPSWRVKLGKLKTAGIPVWPGNAQDLVVDVPEGARLEFATTCMGMVPAGFEDDPPRVKLSIFLDGERLVTLQRETSSFARVQRHSFRLPPGTTGPTNIRFQVNGPPSLLSVHTPVVTNAPPPERAGDQAPPVIVLFSADTFRADNLAAYGGEWGVTPHLDRFAEESLVLENAWSTAAWTLPSHVSMFTGLYPYQHGSTKKLVRLGDDLVVLAEWLSNAGWRTGAITNALYVSASYGMDRGFEWWEERQPMDIEGTLEAALEFLDADDGRPTLLFVHTYRAHGPYKVSEETLAEHGERLDLAHGTAVLRELVSDKKEQTRLAREGKGPRPLPLRHINFKGQWLSMLRAHVRDSGFEDPGEAADRVHSIAEGLRSAYLGGVADLDRAFGSFVDELEDRRVFDRGQLVFTSDHGEAFAEHEAMFHGHGAWDEILRVPLLVRGRGVTPGTDPRYASLVDLPRTIAELAGLPPGPGWEGASLLDPAGRGNDLAFAFDCADDEFASAVLLEAGLKVAVSLEAARSGAPTPGDVRFAHDLARDPGEQAPLEATSARVAALLRSRGAALARLLEARSEAREVDLDEGLLHEMDALGY